MPEVLEGQLAELVTAERVIKQGGEHRAVPLALE
jgi:hypothetical protein